tara:strand:- start:1925 stop:2287 length:363 start_codon:yes stop_codon:yes gene_type:complete
MRVKLSYTVDVEDVLKEAAKLVGLQGEDMQHCVKLFTDLQRELRGETDEEAGVVNIHRAVEMIEEYRVALLNIDRRLEEITEIINGYDEYLLAARAPATETRVTPLEEAEMADRDTFGSD